MGQGQIRKGFFFYFGLFVLLLVAVFMICIVIMMFNPGKTVLWMQYFTANDHIVVDKTTDEEPVDINLNQIDTIEINCGAYAEVIVQKNRQEQFAKEGIHIINNAKGFQKASDAVHFDYKAVLKGTTLELTVTEPKGFLHFSKDVKIVLAAFSDNNTNFENINLIVNSVDGNVSIGNSGLGFVPKDVKLAGLTVNASQAGNIVLGDYFDSSTLGTLSLSTKNGDIVSHNKINYAAKEYTGLSLGCQAKLSTDSGRIELGLLNVGANNVEFGCQTGSVDVDFLKAASVNVTCKRGNFDFGTVDANLNYVGAASDTMITPFIKANYITRDFVLLGQDKAEPEVHINRIDGSFQLFADNGFVDINQAHGEIEVASNGSLKNNIVVAENNSNKIDIQTKSGKIDLGFLGQFKTVNVKTDSGEIVVKVISGIRFEANTYKNNSSVTPELLDVNKITVNIELLDGDDANNSFVVDGKDGTLCVYTNNKVEYKLVAKTDLM